MTITLSKRTLRIKPSATMAVNAKALEMKRAGIDIINLSVGEPDFPTPDIIKAAGIKAIEDNVTHYTPIDGMPELKQGIIDKFKRDNKLDYALNEIIVTPGAKQAVYNACQALLNEGDEVIIPAPFWVSYSAMVELADATPVIVMTDHKQHFKITPAQLEQAITNKTKIVMLNSPSNPTGMIYTLEELQALGEILLKYPAIAIIVDDIYEYIYWDNKVFVTLLNACPALKDRTVLVNGVSKAYAMTGWRIGYTAAPAEITNAMKKVQSHSTSCASSVSQMAAIAALKIPYKELRHMYDEFQKRHDLVVAGLQKIDSITVQKADGAFYLYPYVQAAIDKLGLADDIELATYLLEKAHVATVPGTAFGTPGYLRISCATSAEQLEEAVKRLQKAL
ncbi:MAG: aspartate aminotransferase [Coxiella sp. (in: Bacteria)]|nr:MAG: aspartate aminotransferase [Coxiella sp. (in: g-proteobacteria)]